MDKKEEDEELGACCEGESGKPHKLMIKMRCPEGEDAEKFKKRFS